MSLALKRILSPRRAAEVAARRRPGALYVTFAPLPPQPLRHVTGTGAGWHEEAMATWATTKHSVFHKPIALQLACGQALGRLVVDKILPIET